MMRFISMTAQHNTINPKQSERRTHEVEPVLYTSLKSGLTPSILCLMLLLFSVVSYAALTDNIISYWTFNETNATGQIRDMTGLNNLEQVGTSATTIEAGGILGNGTQLFGSVQNGHGYGGGYQYYAFDNSANFTVVMWVNYSSSAAFDTGHVGEYGANDNGWAMGSKGTGFMRFVGYSTCDLSSSGVQQANVWTMWAVTRQGTNVTLWRNGILNASLVNANCGTFVAAQSAKFGIGGAYFQDFYRNSPSSIDEVGIWNRTLSLTELATINNSIRAGKPYPFEDPVIVEVKSLTPIFNNRWFNGTYSAAQMSDFVDFNIAANYSNQSAPLTTATCNWTGYNISLHVERDFYANYTLNTTSDFVNVTSTESPTNLIYDEIIFTACRNNPSVTALIYVNGTLFRTLDAILPDCSAGTHNELNRTTAFNTTATINVTVKCGGCGAGKILRLTPDNDGGILHYERYFLNHTEPLTYNASTTFYENRAAGQYRQSVQPLNITFRCNTTTNAYSQNITLGNVSVRPVSINNISFTGGMTLEMNTSYSILYEASGGMITYFRVNITNSSGSVIGQYNLLDNETMLVNKSVIPKNGIYNLTAYVISDTGVTGSNSTTFLINDTIDPYVRFTEASLAYTTGASGVVSAACDDVNLFSAQLLISSPAGLAYNASATNINTSSVTLSQSVYFNIFGSWVFNASCWDSHTKRYIQPMDITSDANTGLINIVIPVETRYDYIEHNISIRDITTEKEPIKLEKLDDRYTFGFSYKTAKDKFSYEIECEGIRLMRGSPYNAHVVCPVTHNWVDLESPLIMKTRVSDCGIDCFRFDITTKVPTKTMDFSSIGNMNYAEVIWVANVTASTADSSMLSFGVCPETLEGQVSLWASLAFIMILMIVIGWSMGIYVIGFISGLGGIFWSAVYSGCNNLISTFTGICMILMCLMFLIMMMVNGSLFNYKRVWRR